jgi:hypothetical protein
MEKIRRSGDISPGRGKLSSGERELEGRLSEISKKKKKKKKERVLSKIKAKAILN